MTDPLTTLINVLAELAVEDYLRELASNDADSGAQGENHPLPHDRKAA
ncbi:hypothetical protein BGP89_14040 [Luteimonas sp. JM171]|nr:hypothetical protein [Luteimonas sp. JM171]